MTVQYSIIALYSRDNKGAGTHGQKNKSQSSKILANISGVKLSPKVSSERLWYHNPSIVFSQACGKHSLISLIKMLQYFMNKQPLLFENNIHYMLIDFPLVILFLAIAHQ